LSKLPAISLLAAAKSAITYWTENIKSSRVLKIDIPSVIDVNKNINKHVCSRDVRHLCKVAKQTSSSFKTKKRFFFAVSAAGS